MMPNEPVRHPSGVDQESFIVEMRSYSGYSGSPVFLHYPYPTEKPYIYADPTYRTDYGGPMIHAMYPNKRRSTSRGDAWLLGVDWGHIRHYEPIYREPEEGEGDEPIEIEGYFVKANLGEVGVIPAWVLKDFLCSEGFTEMGMKAEKELAGKKKGSRFDLDSKKPRNAQPFTKENFEEALRRASLKTSEPESEKTET